MKVYVLLESGLKLLCSDMKMAETVVWRYQRTGIKAEIVESFSN